MYSPCDNDPSECNGDVDPTYGTCLQIIQDTATVCVDETDCVAGQVCSGNNFCADVLDAFCSINNCANPATDCETPPGDAPAICVQTFCALDCSVEDCPAGMTCYDVSIAYICA
jgi:hypothetical protein